MAMPRRALQQLRIATGLTQKAVAEAIGVSPDTYAAWERGVRTPLVGFRPLLAKLFEVTLPELNMALGDRPPSQNGEMPEWLDEYVQREQTASHIWAYQPLAVFALLQTSAYAAAVEAADIVGRSGEEIEQRVSLRMARQAVLRREPEPVNLSVLLGEGALRNVATDREAMGDQLGHLLKAAELPNVALHVLPFAAGAFAGAWGGFTIHSASPTGMPTMAFVSDQTGATWLSRSFQIEAHMTLFEHLVAQALPADGSADLIRAIRKEYQNDQAHVA